jgi:hypothetical protein
MFGGPLGSIVTASALMGMAQHGNVTPSPMAALGTAMATMHMMDMMAEAARPIQPVAAARPHTPPPKPKVGFGGIPERDLKRMEAEAAAVAPSLQLQREIAAIEAQKARDEERIRQYEAAKAAEAERVAALKAEQAAAKKSRGWFHWMHKSEPGYEPMKME